MKKFLYLLTLVLLFSACKTDYSDNQNKDLQIIPSQQTYKPWAYWWWMGSSVTKDGLSKNLQAYKEAGLGGLHIIPIYGEKGDEGNFINYLSRQWMEMLVHTVTEATKLGLRIDMTTGTGWPFEGPNLGFKYSAKRFELKEIDLDTVKHVNQLIKGMKGAELIHL